MGNYNFIIEFVLSNIIAILVLVFALTIVWRGVHVVPQSKVFVVERFGKYTKKLNAGLNFVVPFLDSIAHRLSILERQLPEFTISIISRDNVEVRVEATVFYRVVDAAASVYRISDIDQAIYTAATSIVRSAGGKLELDELQSSRESMSDEIARNLQEAATIWGIEITRTEITDVIVDDQTREAQRQQLNAERQRRATIATAEGDKRSVELAAEARLFEAQKEADAVRVRADALAYATEVEAKANATQIRLIAESIAANGQPAIDFEIMKRQVDALGAVASSDNSKTIIMPTDITAAIGSIQVLAETLGSRK
jgi:regulator of protease activity HflC (stomatin/prohibitin superfamily)